MFLDVPKSVNVIRVAKPSDVCVRGSKMFIVMMKNEKCRIRKFTFCVAFFDRTAMKGEILIKPRRPARCPYSTYKIQECFFDSLGRPDYGCARLYSFSQDGSPLINKRDQALFGPGA